MAISLLETHRAVLEQTRNELALLNAPNLLLRQGLFGPLDHLARLVLQGDGLGAFLAANANFVDFGDALAANKLGMDLLGMISEHTTYLLGECKENRSHLPNLDVGLGTGHHRNQARCLPSSAS